jgi:hypothetical protein
MKVDNISENTLSSVLKVCFSETLVSIYESTWHHSPHRKNLKHLKSHIVISCQKTWKSESSSALTSKVILVFVYSTRKHHKLRKRMRGRRKIFKKLYIFVLSSYMQFVEKHNFLKLLSNTDYICVISL